MNTKTCLRCKDEKPEEEFHKSPKYPGGRTSWCKVCIQQNQDYKAAKLAAAPPKTNAQNQAAWRTRRKELLAKLCPKCQVILKGEPL